MSVQSIKQNGEKCEKAPLQTLSLYAWGNDQNRAAATIFHGPAFVSMVRRCWKREGVIEKDSYLRSMPQEVSEVFPGITSACWFIYLFCLKVPLWLSSDQMGTAEFPSKLMGEWKLKWYSWFIQVFSILLFNQQTSNLEMLSSLKPEEAALSPFMTMNTSLNINIQNQRENSTNILIFT